MHFMIQATWWVLYVGQVMLTTFPEHPISPFNESPLCLHLFYTTIYASPGLMIMNGFKCLVTCMADAMRTYLSCLVHVCVRSLMLSLPLPIVCVVFSSLHGVFPSLALYVLMFLLPHPLSNLWLPYVFFLFRFIFVRFLVVFLSCPGVFPSCFIVHPFRLCSVL